jgi:hypothetical protein
MNRKAISDSVNQEAVMKLLSELYHAALTFRIVIPDQCAASRAAKGTRLFDGRVIKS